MATKLEGLEPKFVLQAKNGSDVIVTKSGKLMDTDEHRKAVEDATPKEDDK